MRNVVWILLLFGAAVIAAAGLSENDGLVSIFYNDARLDVSLNVFVIAVVLFVIVLYTALRAVNALVSMPARAHEWRELKRERAAHAALRDAHAEYLAARFNRAAKAAHNAVLPGRVRRQALRRLAFIARLEGDEARGGEFERQAAAID